MRLKGVAALPASFVLKTALEVYRRHKLRPAHDRLYERGFQLQRAIAGTKRAAARRRVLEFREVYERKRFRRLEAAAACRHAAADFLRRCWLTYAFRRQYVARSRVSAIVRDAARGASRAVVAQASPRAGNHGALRMPASVAATPQAPRE